MVETRGTYVGSDRRGDHRTWAAVLGSPPAGGALAGCWEMPGGKTERGESPRQCLARELHEDLAMRVEVEVRCAERLRRRGYGVWYG
jgi:8-oxo-dGTP pyrophosphatase MutT (NUDIX family)